MKLSTLIHEAYTRYDQRKDIRRDISDAVVDTMYLKEKQKERQEDVHKPPKTMYERVGKKTPNSQKLRHQLKSIRDLRTSNTVTKNRGLIRDDINIDVNGIYKAIQEVTIFPGSRAQKPPTNIVNRTQERKVVRPDPTTHLIPKESMKSLEVQRGWQNIKGGK
jgi:hypothetical protein